MIAIETEAHLLRACLLLALPGASEVGGRGGGRRRPPDCGLVSPGPLVTCRAGPSGACVLGLICALGPGLHETYEKGLSSPRRGPHGLRRVLNWHQKAATTQRSVTFSRWLSLSKPWAGPIAYNPELQGPRSGPSQHTGKTKV